MYDGSIVKAKDIQEDDLLMGDDSTPRRVLSTCTGKDDMFRLETSKGDVLTVNSAHMLSLKCSYGNKIKWEPTAERYRATWNENGKRISKTFSIFTHKTKDIAKSRAEEFLSTLISGKGEVIDISVIDYLAKSKTWKDQYRLFKVGVDFPKQDKELLIDPYFLGLWLGDGDSINPEITTIETEIVEWLTEYAEQLGQTLKQKKDRIVYAITGPTSGLRLRSRLRMLNLLGNKHIPEQYLKGSKETRIKVLAGLIDSDGYLDSRSKSTYEITQKRRKLMKDIVFLARSLGFACYSRLCEKTCTNAPGGPKKGIYQRGSIYGEGLEQIPVLVPRKKAVPRKQIKDALVLGFTITPLGRGKYCGFTLDGNHRFLLDNFIVTHNTYLLREIAVYLQEKGKVIGVTATTGVAALNLNIPERKIQGRTLHSWGGVGLGDEVVAKLVAKIMSKPAAKKRWYETDILIIDEISMLGGDFFDKLDFIGRMIRQREMDPMGGIQLIISGDFLQLPPVKDEFCFQSLAWKELALTPFIFLDPKRYDDPEYFQLLLRARDGEPTNEDIKCLYARVQAYEHFCKMVEECDDETKIIKPTKAYSHRSKVEYTNDKELEKLPGITYDFNCIDSLKQHTKNFKKDYYLKQLEDAAPRQVSLKVGSQVMLKCNMSFEQGLVNGSRGVVTEIDFEMEVITVKFLRGRAARIERYEWEFEDKDGKGVRSQIPLILAWACTIHKCVSENTIISTERGLEYIKELTDQDGWSNCKFSLPTRNGVENAVKIYKGENEDSFIITTRLGYSIEGSIRHPILVRTEKGKEIWKKLPDIKEGDYVILRSDTNLVKDRINVKNYCDAPPFDEVTGDFAYMLGILVGDGSYRDIKDGTVDFSNTDEELLNEYVKIVKKLFDVRICHYKNRRYFCRKKARKFLVLSGLDYLKAQKKKIPWVILQSPNDVQRDFIKGLFDADGGVNKTSVHFTSSSEILAKEVHILLLHLSIISRRYYMPNDKSGAWRIEITGYDSRTYMKDIGFISKKKNNCWNIWHTNKFIRIPKSNIGQFPDSPKIALKIQKHYNLTKKDGISQLISSCNRRRSNLHIRHIQYLSEHLDLQDTKIGRELLEYNNLGLFCDKVKTIEQSECLMYDLEVPVSHSFISNGIVSHNCQGATLDFCILDLGYTIFACGQAYVGLSRVRSLKGLFLSSFEPSSIIASQTALKYSKELQLKEKSMDKDYRGSTQELTESNHEDDIDSEVELTDVGSENTIEDEEWDKETFVKEIIRENNLSDKYKVSGKNKRLKLQIRRILKNKFKILWKEISMDTSCLKWGDHFPCASDDCIQGEYSKDDIIYEFIPKQEKYCFGCSELYINGYDDYILGEDFENEYISLILEMLKSKVSINTKWDEEEFIAELILENNWVEEFDGDKEYRGELFFESDTRCNIVLAEVDKLWKEIPFEDLNLQFGDMPPCDTQDCWYQMERERIEEFIESYKFIPTGKMMCDVCYSNKCDSDEIYDYRNSLQQKIIDTIRNLPIDTKIIFH